MSQAITVPFRRNNDIQDSEIRFFSIGKDVGGSWIGDEIKKIQTDEERYKKDLQERVETLVNLKLYYNVPFSIYDLGIELDAQKFGNEKVDLFTVWVIFEKTKHNYIWGTPQVKIIDGYFVYRLYHETKSFEFSRDKWTLKPTVKSYYNLEQEKREFVMGYKKVQEEDVKKVLRTLVVNKQLFSHYDVVHLLRLEGFYADLSEIRNIIDKVFQTKNPDGLFFGYERDTYRLTSTPFLVYKPIGVNVLDYNVDLDKFVDVMKKQEPKLVAGITTPNTVVEPVKPKRKRYPENRIRIPAKYVRLYGYKVGDLAHIGVKSNDEYFLYDKKMTVKPVCDRNFYRKVDKNGNVRFTPEFPANEVKYVMYENGIEKFPYWGYIQKKEVQK